MNPTVTPVPTVAPIPDTYPEGTEKDKNGNLVTPEGIVISSDGTVTLPDGTELTPDAGATEVSLIALIGAVVIK